LTQVAHETDNADLFSFYSVPLDFLRQGFTWAAEVA
jgi:hypothetical protein